MRPLHLRPSTRSDAIHSLLVIHQGALGDFILALPVFEVLRGAFPKAKLVMMGFPRILELVHQRYYADEIHSVDQKGMASFFVRGGRLDRSLSQFFGSFNLIVAFSKNEGGTFIGNLRQVCEGSILPIDPFPRGPERVHMSDHLLKELARYGFSAFRRAPRLFLNERDEDWARSFWRMKGVSEEERSKAIVIHPGSGSRKKVWPLERFLELIKYLQRVSASRIVIVLGPAEGAEVQDALDETVRTSATIRPIVLKDLSLLELGSVIKGCRLFIGNDSGITHMAAALGLPTIAIFGPSDHKVWSPRGEKVRLVRKEIPCAPCSEERFINCQHAECLRSIQVRDLVDEVEQLYREP